MYPEIFISPEFDVSLDDSSSAAFFNYATTTMCNGTPPPVTIPHVDGPGRGHERPPPAIVCGKNGENFQTKILKLFQKLKVRNLPSPRRQCPPRGPLAPPFRREAGTCATLLPSSAMQRRDRRNHRGLQTLSYRLLHGTTLPAPSGSYPPGPYR